MAKCSECGTNIPDNIRFCPQCGAAAAGAAAAAAGAAAGGYQQQSYQAPPQQNYQQNYQAQGSYQQQNYQPQGGYQQQNYQQEAYEAPQRPRHEAPSQDAADFRILMALSYLSFVFLVPALILGKDSNYVRRHTNQVIALNLFGYLCALVMIIPILGWIVGVVGMIANFVFLIIAIVRALRYDIFVIPITGKWRIIPEKND